MSVKITKNEIKEFVIAAHGNLAKVQEMLTDKPGLRDLPNGNETALGAACQMRHRALIEYLLSQGAEPDIYTACVLGQKDVVLQYLEADPALVNTKNPRAHGKPPTYFAENEPEILALLKERGGG